MPFCGLRALQDKDGNGFLDKEEVQALLNKLADGGASSVVAKMGLLATSHDGACTAMCYGRRRRTSQWPCRAADHQVLLRLTVHRKGHVQDRKANQLAQLRVVFDELDGDNSGSGLPADTRRLRIFLAPASSSPRGPPRPAHDCSRVPRVRPTAGTLELPELGSMLKEAYGDYNPILTVRLFKQMDGSVSDGETDRKIDWEEFHESLLGLFEIDDVVSIETTMARPRLQLQ